MIGDGAKNRVGPHLNGIIGREIGAIADYKYSKAMVNMPPRRKLVGGTLPPIWKVRQSGERRAHGLCRSQKKKDRADVIAYLKENAK